MLSSQDARAADSQQRRPRRTQPRPSVTSRPRRDGVRHKVSPRHRDHRDRRQRPHRYSTRTPSHPRSTSDPQLPIHTGIPACVWRRTSAPVPVLICIDADTLDALPGAACAVDRGAGRHPYRLARRRGVREGDAL